MKSAPVICITLMLLALVRASVPGVCAAHGTGGANLPVVSALSGGAVRGEPAAKLADRAAAAEQSHRCACQRHQSSVGGQPCLVAQGGRGVVTAILHNNLLRSGVIHQADGVLSHIGPQPPRDRGQFSLTSLHCALII